MTADFKILRSSPWSVTGPILDQVRYEHRYDPAALPINALIDQFRAKLTTKIPYIDPFCGGINARVLLVLKDPGPRGSDVTGMLSLGNNDRTALNTRVAILEAGLTYADLMFWNAYPWSPTVDVTWPRTETGAKCLSRLLPLLPQLEVVVLMGGEAKAVGARVKMPGSIKIVSTYHPGPKAWNRSILREHIVANFRELGLFLRSS